MDFFVTITAIVSFTTASAIPLCKGGALRLGRPGDCSLTVLVQEIHSLLVVLGIAIVSGGYIVLQIHREFVMLSFALPQEGI
jgi:hypothetical protein